MLAIITSAIRHGITTVVGGYLASGIITGDQVEQLTNSIVGAVTIVAVVGWSIIEKKYFTKK